MALEKFTRRLYSSEGVEPRLIALQDEYNLNITLLLFVAWVNRDGNAVTRADINELWCGLMAWDSDVIKPLRAVRRRMKSRPDLAFGPTSDALRARVKACEIDGELIMLDELDRAHGRRARLEGDAGCGAGLSLRGAIRQVFVTTAGRAPVPQDAERVLDHFASVVEAVAASASDS